MKYRMPFILFFTIMTFMRAESMSAFLAHAFTLFLMAGLAVTYQGGAWFKYSLADYFVRGLDLLCSMAARPIMFIVELRQGQAESSETEMTLKQKRRIWPILRGLVLAVPVVVFFAALLSSADMIFAQRVNELTAIFRLENLPEYIFRFTYILVIAYILAGVYLHAAKRSTDEKLLGLEKPIVPPFLGFTEASIVLGSVVLLFASFVLVQFQYFFGGQVNIHLDGYTYADYARKGFGELVIVAFFALLLFLGLTAVTMRKTDLHRKIFSGLGLALLALVGFMLVSAYQRLVLYETAYGFTRLRTYTHVFMVWVAVLLALVVVLDLMQRQRFFALAVLLASLGFAISIIMINVDTFIFQRNLARFDQGQSLDVGYLASLSPDAIPTIVQVFETPQLKAETRDRLGAVLVCMENRNNFSGMDNAWQAFHLSNFQAIKSLKKIESDLKAYQLDVSDWPVTVTTPLGAKYECYSDTQMD